MCKGGSWKGESVWHCSDGETKRATIEGAKTGIKKETESGSPVIAGGLLKALLGVIQRSPASLSRAAIAVHLPLTGWWSFAILYFTVEWISDIMGTIILWLNTRRTA